MTRPLNAGDTKQTLLIKLASVLCDLKTSISNRVQTAGLFWNADQNIWQELKVQGLDGAEFIEVVDTPQPAPQILGFAEYAAINAVGSIASLAIEDNALNPPTVLPIDDMVGENVQTTNSCLLFEKDTQIISATYAIQFDKSGGGTANCALWAQISLDDGVTFVDVDGSKWQFEVSKTSEITHTFLIGSGGIDAGTKVRAVCRALIGTGVSITSLPATTGPDTPAGRAVRLTMPRQRTN